MSKNNSLDCTNIDKVVSVFQRYYSLGRSSLENKLKQHQIIELQIFATQIGIIPHNNKDKMIQKISFKMTRKNIK